MTQAPTSKPASGPTSMKAADPRLQLALSSLSKALSETSSRHFAGDLHGKLVLACGLAGAGAVQPLGSTRQGAAFLGIEPDSERIKDAVKAGYCEIMVNSLDEALRILKNAVRSREPASVGLIGDCATVLSELAERGVVPDVILLGAAVPAGSARITELQRLGSLLIESGSTGARK